MRRVLLPHHFSEHPAPVGGTIRDFRGDSMGTTWSVRVLAVGDCAPLQEGLQQQLDVVVAQMSHWFDDSSLGRFNHAAAGTWHSLPAAFFEVLAFAAQVARDSGGAYDPCAGALVNAWGFGPTRRHDQPGYAAPSPDAVAALLARRRGQDVALDPLARRAYQPGGALLDLSAVAKGYAVDCLARYLEAQGWRHYLVEVGGELRGAGTKPDGQPWWVALEQVVDADAAGQVGEMVLALHGLAVATSGDYRRFFERDGARFSHTIDPRSGMPISNALASVTVVHAECMAADAWSTALTVLGPEAGMALAERLGLAARFLVRSGGGLREHLSRPLQDMLDE
ncbi:FAD:protein FMN transferase [Janthinobacterium fluminis]|uniref:FAD:protein FMN transferase n=1 Tax=Janthinobacterium fluminis TaxID=2987524 RepID=A0ABT5K2E8_9BURK|nr:FAD:protein FMN transferase [Janthinobacterium fluminis]MDC8759140.1 FAD:protein FMN transferase [Janthinobacterium fluminis]